MQFRFVFSCCPYLHGLGGRVVGWVVGRLESNAILNSRSEKLKLKFELSLAIQVDNIQGVKREYYRWIVFRLAG